MISMPHIHAAKHHERRDLPLSGKRILRLRLRIWTEAQRSASALGPTLFESLKFLGEFQVDVPFGPI